MRLKSAFTNRNTNENRIYSILASLARSIRNLKKLITQKPIVAIKNCTQILVRRVLIYNMTN